MGKLNAK